MDLPGANVPDIVSDQRKTISEKLVACPIDLTFGEEIEGTLRQGRPSVEIEDPDITLEQRAHRKPLETEKVGWQSLSKEILIRHESNRRILDELPRKCAIWLTSVSGRAPRPSRCFP